MRKKPDAIIIQADTNDLTNDIKTMKYARSIAKIIEGINDRGNTQIGFLGISGRRYIRILVRQLKTLRKG